jgi:hypothetical protein
MKSKIPPLIEIRMGLPWRLDAAQKHCILEEYVF